MKKFGGLLEDPGLISIARVIDSYHKFRSYYHQRYSKSDML